MGIVDLEQAYASATEDDISDAERIKRTIAFKVQLNNHLAPEFDDYHFNLLRNRKYRLLYQTIRSQFDKRPNAEKYLLEKSRTETDPEVQADILQILGHLRSSHAALMAKEYLQHANERHKEVALFVLGWVGGEEHIALLRKHMLQEENPHLRITAASAHRQIAWHYKELKDAVLRSLKIGFENEKDDNVLSWIIVMIGTVAVKNLGLREDKEEPDILHGDLEKAKVKTKKFIETLT